MSLRIRRGTESQRLATVAEAGEILWTTDQRKLWVGTGASNNPGNASMVNVGKGLAGTGLVWNDTDQVLEVGNFSITTTDVSEGTNLYFRTDRAQTATQAMFTSVDATHTGISFLYNDIDQTVNATVSLSIDDLSDVQIVGTPATNSVLKYNGASWTASTDTVGMTSLQQDTTPTLGGDLDLNSNDITGTGNIDVTGVLNVHSTTPNISTAITAFSITDGTDALPGWTETIISKGNWASPVNPAAGNFLGGYKIAALISGENKPVGLLAAELTATANLTSATPASNIYIAAANNSGVTRYKFRPDGVFEAPILKAANYETISLPTLPEKGWIAFDSTTNQFKGWNGTSWAVLG